MKKRIHILGAAGSGTTTLAMHLSRRLGYTHLDSDNYFWQPTNPPFQKKRQRSQRQKLLRKDLNKKMPWVLSGSLCGWGDIFIKDFDLIVYLWIPEDIRMERLKEREKKNYGHRILETGDMYQTHLDFMDYASQYDTGDLTIRSRKLHDQWLKKVSCPVLSIERVIPLEEKIEKVLAVIKG